MLGLKRNKKLGTGETKNFARTFILWLKKEKTKKLVRTLLMMAAVLAAGFFAGRKTVYHETETNTVYLPGEPIEVEKEVPGKPIFVNVPPDTLDVIADCIRKGKFKELFPSITKDSIVYVTKEDTAAVLADWATERIYEQKIFDIDTIGSAIVKARAQYNRITWIGSTFTPVIKHTTVTEVVGKKYAPFVGAGITTMPEIVVNGGLYFDDKYGASVLYEYNWEMRRHAVGLMGTIKF